MKNISLTNHLLLKFVKIQSPEQSLMSFQLCRNLSGVIKESLQGIRRSQALLVQNLPPTPPSSAAANTENPPPAALTAPTAPEKTHRPVVTALSSMGRNSREAPVTPREQAWHPSRPLQPTLAGSSPSFQMSNTKRHQRPPACRSLPASDQEQISPGRS